MKRRAKKLKIVQGFGIKGQSRTKFRGTSIDGTYEGYYWVVFSEGDGLFQWRIGGLSGFTGPMLGDSLRSMKKAVKAIKALEAIYGEVPEQQRSSLVQILRWEARAREGRVSITGPYGKGENKHYKVREL